MLPRYNLLMRPAVIAAVLLALCSCGNTEQEQSRQPLGSTQTESGSYPDVAPTTTQTEAPSPLTQFFLEQAQKGFSSTCSTAEQLQRSIERFLSTPSQKGLTEAKQAWASAHQHYLATQLFRNINIQHPILDKSTTDPVQHSIFIRIDQTPLLPGYLDQIEGYPKTGYVFSSLPIDRQTLNKEHQFADTAYVALGFHAIEFLLWGETNRPFTDFLALSTELKSGMTDNPDTFKLRRSKLLALTTNLLVEDLKQLCNEWNIDGGYYATSLRKQLNSEQHSAISAAVEQSIANIQVEIAKIRQAKEEDKEIELHSAFANNNQLDTQRQIETLDTLIKSTPWKNASKQDEHAMKLTTLAATLTFKEASKRP
ncbi:imelysin family protein [Alkalimarinus coralli]|uniref:imelysin family protein n=1 Tax=Alkalimarinus coralli TaxID=2935863 RepID=UPI00202AFA5C|nr:imelysin family protein [Alkalimarinus coralli]